MKQLLKLTACTILLGIWTFISCKKEFSFEDGNDGNRSPIANAGADQTISLPKDSVVLDGSASTDPDGVITFYKWAKIAGPDSSNIVIVDSAKTSVKTLMAGVYKFELTVTDNGGLTAKDTVQVVVEASGNQPPAACAGSNEIINLPANSTDLNGSCSADPDNNITTYNWTKIAGPSSSNIASAHAVQTQVTGLVPGIYQFELRVGDAGGLFSKDTIHITVNAVLSVIACDGSTRPQLPAQLVSTGSLSVPRLAMTAAASGTKIIFAGGFGTPVCPECLGSARVDIYDTVTRTWSTAQLTQGRWGIAAIAAGNKIFFAGGESGDGAFDTYYSTVDIYDVASDTWSVASLSEPRSKIAVAVVGDNVFFAGGEKNFNYEVSDKIDIYNLQTDSWSTSSLSAPRAHISALTVNNKIYFAGGTGENRFLTPSKVIDVYDNARNSWSTSSLSEPKSFMGGIAFGGKAYWAGGLTAGGVNQLSCTLEILDTNTGNTSTSYLFKPAAWSNVSGENVVIKNNKILYIRCYTGSGDPNSHFDIYDIATASWSVGILPRSMNFTSVVSLNNTIYVSDGSKAWKLEF